MTAISSCVQEEAGSSVLSGKPLSIYKLFQENQMKKGIITSVVGTCLLALVAAPAFATDLTADQALTKLKEGNERFVSGKSMHPHTDAARLALAGSEDQGKHAFATVISCSDSRVPVELLFDTGIMDTFIIRVAGNVIDTDEAGSIEYGLAHVNTPLFVVLGHTQCGAVKAVTAATLGHGHPLEINIPPLVDNIGPAVKRAIEKNPKAEEKDIVPAAITENVWQSVTDLFMRSAKAREMVKEGKVKVVGALYDVSTGKVEWLPEDKVASILTEVEKNPKRQMQAMADEGKGHEEHGSKKEEHKAEPTPEKEGHGSVKK
jgi:carbonic anhydrase